MKITQLSVIKPLLLAVLVAGTLDIAGAILILANGNAAGTLKFIASGLIGSGAFTGGTGTMILGLVIHFFIAFCFSVLYFIVYEKIAFFRSNRFVSSFVYGLFIWATMKFLVLPLTQLPSRGAIQWESALSEILILTVAFGVTLPFFASKVK